MMWNNNDTKYIIKRLILYLLISGIVFFSATQCTKATVISSFIDNFNNENVNNTMSYVNFTQTGEYFKGNNNGYIIINMITTKQGIKEVRIVNATSQFECSLGGSFVYYYDNTTSVFLYSLKCPVQFSSSNGLKTIRVEFSTGGLANSYIRISPLITYVTEDSDASSIINAQNQATQQEINAINSASGNQIQAILDQTSSIQNAVNNATQQEINAINANTTAINNQTNAINAQTEWQQQDFQVDVSQITAVQDLISTGDKNKIRDLLMFPVRLLMLVGAHLSVNYCYNFNLGNLLGTDLILPCINLRVLIGSNLYDTIDVIFSIGIYIGLIIYLRKLLDYLFTLGNTSFESVNVEVFK